MPLGMYPEAPAEVIVTEGFLTCSLWVAGAPLTMVTPGDWDCCIGLPFTAGDIEADFPCCAEPSTVTGAAVESVADF